jgi:hypothetical protein
MVNLLLDRGADIDFHNGGPLMGALYYDQCESAQLLADRGARMDLVAAAGLGRIGAMAHWLEVSGPLPDDVYSLAHYSQTPKPPQVTDAQVLSLAMVYACMGGHLVAAERLRERGADIGPCEIFDHRATPLHWAAYRGYEAVIERLLAWGADPAARGRDLCRHASGLGDARRTAGRRQVVAMDLGWG